ncbi:D-glycerate dehydrogenase [Pusillimonas sp. MFBS29]|uniref:2-hydroxyacid dehydrogenase n=1 Tax=Pusillimonas sp. MFBS29 TaxID=2886690 RepID=UPI001D10C610|nr:D-glycerate dehydrogenase [Pusillimonas sp. MFBS29]MCC2597217.1 D-glycerate dehydrogenase [Pusillimonas sp. MFBS29]
MTTQPKLYVACNFPPEVLDFFTSQFDAAYNDMGRVLSTDELIEHAQGADVVVLTATDPLDQAAVARLPASVKVVCTYSVGNNHLDLDALEARGIAVFSTPGVLDEACADAAWLLMLGAARRVIEGIELIREGTWQGWSPRQLIGREVWGSRLGILGMGRIGRAIARRARGFDMTVHYHNRNRLGPELESGAQYHSTLESLARESDFLCIACPASPSTQGLVNREILQLLPPNAVVCNISRGDIVCDEDLVHALETGVVAAAGLDVFAGEPDIHPAYRQLPNVFGLPHIGSSTLRTRLAMAELLCSSIKAHYSGETPENRIR